MILPSSGLQSTTVLLQQTGTWKQYRVCLTQGNLLECDVSKAWRYIHRRFCKLFIQVCSLFLTPNQHYNINTCNKTLTFRAGSLQNELIISVTSRTVPYKRRVAVAVRVTTVIEQTEHIEICFKWCSTWTLCHEKLYMYQWCSAQFTV